MTGGGQDADQKIDETIGTLLRVGVIVSAAVVLCGGVCYLAQAGGAPRDYRHFRPEAADLRSLSGVVGRAAHLSCPHLIQFGLLLLIATPVARVVFTVFAFWRQRDRMFVAITLVVLAILLFSLAGGQRWL